ncbi:MAG: CBS domain-containing protein [Solirubrobacteraceae bacterium]
MRVEDVMTTTVATVAPETSLKEVARELAERQISGMPVVDEAGAVVGVISEADILAKEQAADPRHARLLSRLLDRSAADDQLKLDARTAGEAMTSPPITIEAFWSVASAAERMLTNKINRLPVVRQGRLAGIVTRADIVRAFARTDETIAREVREQIDLTLALAGDTAQVDFTIDNGQVTLDGRVEQRRTAETIPYMLALVPGVVATDSNLSWTTDER